MELTMTQQSRRQTTVFFTIPDGNGNHPQVCKQTFTENHGITRRRVETLVRAKKMVMLPILNVEETKLKRGGIIQTMFSVL